MKPYNQPTNQKAEVLYLLLTRKYVTRREAMVECGILNLPAQIEILRHKHNVPITLRWVETVNKFGRPISYGRFSVAKNKYTRGVYRIINTKN